MLASSSILPRSPSFPVLISLLIDIVDSDSVNQELRHELTNCQIALADAQNEKIELAEELKRLHEKFAACNDAEYTRVRIIAVTNSQDCELKIINLNEQLEALTGILAGEKEGRLLDSDAHSRAMAVIVLKLSDLQACREKENAYRLRIEAVEKELLEKCNTIGTLNEELAGMQEICL